MTFPRAQELVPSYLKIETNARAVSTLVSGHRQIASRGELEEEANTTGCEEEKRGTSEEIKVIGFPYLIAKVRGP